MRGQLSTTFVQCTTGFAWCVTNVTTTHQPHQTPSTAMAGRTANPQEREAPMSQSCLDNCQQETYMELISPNWESEQRSQGEFGFHWAALLGMPPIHWHGPGGEPDGEGTTHQPATSCHLFSCTSRPGGCLLIQNHTRHLPAMLDFISLRLKVTTIKVGRIKLQQYWKLGNNCKNCNSDKTLHKRCYNYTVYRSILLLTILSITVWSLNRVIFQHLGPPVSWGSISSCSGY